MINWQDIDTLLLDMDGTLLDLYFDNLFWTQHLPQAMAEHQGLSLEDAQALLVPMLAEQQGQLNWYCTDYWSARLGLNLCQLKLQILDQVRYRDGSLLFLQALRQLPIQVLIVTNAHPDTFVLKDSQTQLSQWVHRVISSHSYRAAKESQVFWQQLRQEYPFEPERTLLIDDSLAVLASAKTYGIRHLLAISQPDSQQPARQILQYPQINDLSELLL